MDFIRRKTVTEAGEATVTFTYDPAEGEPRPFPPFSVVATERGVRSEGKSPLVGTFNDLQDWARIISEAWNEHKAMQPKPREPVLLPADTEMADKMLKAQG